MKRNMEHLVVQAVLHFNTDTIVANISLVCLIDVVYKRLWFVVNGEKYDYQRISS